MLDGVGEALAHGARQRAHVLAGRRHLRGEELKGTRTSTPNSTCLLREAHRSGAQLEKKHGFSGLDLMRLWKGFDV